VGDPGASGSTVGAGSGGFFFLLCALVFGMMMRACMQRWILKITSIGHPYKGYMVQLLMSHSLFESLVENFARKTRWSNGVHVSS
jgi:hypothetical protein